MRRDTLCVVILLAGVLLTAPAGAADVHIGVNIGTPTPVVVVSCRRPHRLRWS